MAAMMRFARVSSSGALLAFALATSSCVAMRRASARGDVPSAMFVAASTLLLVALIAAVRAHERAGDGDYPDAGRRMRREALKVAAWALSAALTVLFAHRVAALAPAPPFAVLVWSMAAATVGGGFYLLFVHGRGEPTTSSDKKC